MWKYRSPLPLADLLVHNHKLVVQVLPFSHLQHLEVVCTSSRACFECRSCSQQVSGSCCPLLLSIVEMIRGLVEQKAENLHVAELSRPLGRAVRAVQEKVLKSSCTEWCCLRIKSPCAGIRASREDRPSTIKEGDQVGHRSV